MHEMALFAKEFSIIEELVVPVRKCKKYYNFNIKNFENFKFSFYLENQTKKPINQIENQPGAVSYSSYK